MWIIASEAINEMSLVPFLLSGAAALWIASFFYDGLVNEDWQKGFWGGMMVACVYVALMTVFLTCGA